MSLEDRPGAGTSVLEGGVSFQAAEQWAGWPPTGLGLTTGGAGSQISIQQGHHTASESTLLILEPQPEPWAVRHQRLERLQLEWKGWESFLKSKVWGRGRRVGLGVGPVVKAVAGGCRQLGSPSCWSLALAPPEASPPGLALRALLGPFLVALLCQGPVSPYSAGMFHAGGAGGPRGAVVSGR